MDTLLDAIYIFLAASSLLALLYGAYLIIAYRLHTFDEQRDSHPRSMREV